MPGSCMLIGKRFRDLMQTGCSVAQFSHEQLGFTFRILSLKDQQRRSPPRGDHGVRVGWDPDFVERCSPRSFPEFQVVL